MWMYSGAANAWQHVVADLSSFANQNHIMSTVGLGVHSATGYGTWDVWIANMAIVRKDGSVLPIFTGQDVSSDMAATSCGGNSQYLATQLTPTTDAKASTNYYLDDRLGTAQMELSGGGWPLWQGQFTPFGQELPDGTTSMHYKFTGKERDAESGLDYFGARYYASNIGRWMSPDWADKPEAVPYSSLDDPQSLNLYGYVHNNPLSLSDLDGHWPDWNSTFGQSVIGIGKELYNATAAPAKTMVSWGEHLAAPDLIGRPKSSAFLSAANEDKLRP